MWSPTTIKGFKAHGDRIGTKRFASKSGHSKKNTSSTVEAMPVYRPAGPNIGPPKRQAHESVADQIRRVALGTSGPKQAHAERSVPPNVWKEVPGPPPLSVVLGTM